MDIAARRRPTLRWSGFTLVELVATLVIASIVLAAGVPEFRRMRTGSEMTTAVNTLVAHLHLARSVAVKRGTRAVLCPSQDGSQCLATPEWHRGYILFADRNGDRERGLQEPLVGVYPATNGILITSSRSRRRISYRPDGSSPGTNLTMIFCDPHRISQPKAIILSNTGRSRVSSTRADGQALVCG